MMNYSFTTTSDSSQMLLTQAMHHDLHDYVVNGFRANTGCLQPNWTKEKREAHWRSRAEVLIGRFPTITDFDALSEN
jgi:hypothetical protein